MRIPWENPPHAKEDSRQDPAGKQAGESAIMDELRNPASTLHPVDHAPHPSREEHGTKQNFRDMPERDHFRHNLKQCILRALGSNRSSSPKPNGGMEDTLQLD